MSAQGGVCRGVHLPHPWTEFLAHACENIIFPQLRLWTVIIFKVLVEEEQEERRSLVQKGDVDWDPNDVAHAQFLYIGVQTLTWNPRRPILRGKWFPQTRRLIQVFCSYRIKSEKRMFCKAH